MVSHFDPWEGALGDPEADICDYWESTRSLRARIRQRKYYEARERQPKCSVSDCERKANFGFHGLCTHHDILRITSK